ncbi:chemotaxis protein CheA [Methylobacterium planeticum]|uniref:Chemotaxis protein CheA n=1 Tax=Methylobacterium planeticum TaxID=2615211 RepID=A0A6N6MNU9_9HYPH|nr:chemotaxis protein CheA [Methylobacterium planeticum]KAB1072586.1 chemotaxis protein CheA [Methylobacterium planeticum]
MNDLFEQFLIEARELIQSATEDLLALESAPGEGEAVNRVFRAFHTLKGSVGLFDFPPLLEVLHAAEDGLVAARAGTVAVDAILIDLSLETLDAVARWTDTIEGQGDLPATAGSEGGTLVARFRALLAPTLHPIPRAAESAATTRPDWVAALVADALPLPEGVPLTALRYVPRADCFFAGDDPIGLVRRLPSLVALTVVPVEPWPETGEHDAFTCNLAITLLTAEPRAEVEAVFRVVRDQITLEPLVDPAPAIGVERASATLPVVVAAILTEQLRVIATPGDADSDAGRREAAGQAAANALRSVRRGIAAEACARAAQQGREALSRVLESVLEGRDGVALPPSVPLEPSAETSRLLRIDAARVDTLIALAGELVVARNALNHLVLRAVDGIQDAGLSRAMHENDALIGRLAADLHRNVTGLRLLPMAQVFRRFRRPVREIARSLGKDVTLDVRGEDIEADKGIVETLFDPLLHVLRNALDHGLEEPAERRQAGKPETGRIVLGAEVQEDSIVVTLSDDGRGIDPVRIRAAARERGLVAADGLATMSDAAVIDLIFTPGFSTAARVSDVSGRGVGMDVVRAAATRIGGRVSVASQVGRGTTIRLALPHRIALTRIMLVKVGPDLYGLPLDSVGEVVRRRRDQILDLGPGRATVHRGRTVPVVGLADLLGTPVTARLGDGSPDAEARLLVLRSSSETVALEVDSLGARLDVLTRPLTGLVADAPGIAGTTVLGDGRVLLVLDPQALLARSFGTETSGALSEGLP